MRDDAREVDLGMKDGLRRLLDEKFASGNCIPVERVNITRSEYEAAVALQQNASTSLPKITHVAILHAGEIHSLPAPNRHHHVIRAMGGIPGPDVQGFLDETGRFLTREEAYELATRNGQMIRPNDPTKYQGKLLFSEDLW